MQPDVPTENLAVTVTITPWFKDQRNNLIKKLVPNNRFQGKDCIKRVLSELKRDAKLIMGYGRQHRDDYFLRDGFFKDAILPSTIKDAFHDRFELVDGMEKETCQSNQLKHLIAFREAFSSSNLPISKSVLPEPHASLLNFLKNTVEKDQEQQVENQFRKVIRFAQTYKITGTKEDWTGALLQWVFPFYLIESNLVFRGDRATFEKLTGWSVDDIRKQIQEFLHNQSHIKVSKEKRVTFSPSLMVAFFQMKAIQTLMSPDVCFLTFQWIENLLRQIRLEKSPDSESQSISAHDYCYMFLIDLALFRSRQEEYLVVYPPKKKSDQPPIISEAQPAQPALPNAKKSGWWAFFFGPKKPQAPKQKVERPQKQLAKQKSPEIKKLQSCPPIDDGFSQELWDNVFSQPDWTKYMTCEKDLPLDLQKLQNCQWQSTPPLNTICPQMYRTYVSRLDETSTKDAHAWCENPKLNDKLIQKFLNNLHDKTAPMNWLCEAVEYREIEKRLQAFPDILKKFQENPTTKPYKSLKEYINGLIAGIVQSSSNTLNSEYFQIIDRYQKTHYFKDASILQLLDSFEQLSQLQQQLKIWNTEPTPSQRSSQLDDLLHRLDLVKLSPEMETERTLLQNDILQHQIETEELKNILATATTFDDIKGFSFPLFRQWNIDMRAKIDFLERPHHPVVHAPPRQKQKNKNTNRSNKSPQILTSIPHPSQTPKQMAEEEEEETPGWNKETCAAEMKEYYRPKLKNPFAFSHKKILSELCGNPDMERYKTDLASLLPLQMLCHLQEPSKHVQYPWDSIGTTVCPQVFERKDHLTPIHEFVAREKATCQDLGAFHPAFQYKLCNTIWDKFMERLDPRMIFIQYTGNSKKLVHLQPFILAAQRHGVPIVGGPSLQVVLDQLPENMTSPTQLVLFGDDDLRRAAAQWGITAFTIPNAPFSPSDFQP